MLWLPKCQSNPSCVVSNLQGATFLLVSSPFKVCVQCLATTFGYQEHKVVPGGRETLPVKFCLKTQVIFNPPDRVTLALGLTSLLVNRT